MLPEYVLANGGVIMARATKTGCIVAVCKAVNRDNTLCRWVEVFNPVGECMVTRFITSTENADDYVRELVAIW